MNSRLMQIRQPGTGGRAPATHPAVNENGQASPQAVATMPVARVLVYPSPSQAGYATIAYRGLQPLWAPDGEPILADAPGRWGQLAMAGRP